MKAVSLALLYLGSVSFLGVEAAAKLDLAQDFKRNLPDPEESPIHVKRYRQRAHTLGKRQGCRLGTCTTQNLAHQIYHMTDKDKDVTPPPKKLGPRGYGRRRRRSPSGSRFTSAAWDHHGGTRTLRSRLHRAPAASPRGVPV